MDFAIKKISSYEDTAFQLPYSDILFKHCFRCLATGPSGCGKSTVLANLLLNPDFGFDSFFTQIYIFSNTAMNDDVYAPIIGNIIPSVNIIDNVEEMPEVIENIINIQKDLKSRIKEFQEDRGKADLARDLIPKVLLIFDDMASEELIKTKQFKQLFFKSRHNGISLFVCMQYFQLLPKDCRQNISNFLIFQIQRAEITSICEQLCPAFLTNRQFTNMVSQVTDQAFDFLHINNKKPVKERFFRNFNNMIKFA